MEARAAGCAIVATDVGGNAETLEGGTAGQLVPVHDPTAMAKALRRLMADPGELARWRERALQGSSFFTVRRMSEDYLTLYRSLITRTPLVGRTGAT